MKSRRPERFGVRKADAEPLYDDEITALMVGYDECAMRHEQGGRPPAVGSENRSMVRLHTMLHARTRRHLARQARGNDAQPF